MIGDIQNNFTVSCKNHQEEEIFWTFSHTSDFIKLEPAGNEMDHQKKFKLLIGSGTGLIKFAKGSRKRGALKVGVILEGIYNFVPSSKNHKS